MKLNFEFLICGLFLPKALDILDILSLSMEIIIFWTQTKNQREKKQNHSHPDCFSILDTALSLMCPVSKLAPLFYHRPPNPWLGSPSTALRGPSFTGQPDRRKNCNEKSTANFEKMEKLR